MMQLHSLLIHCIALDPLCDCYDLLQYDRLSYKYS
jgi:hypothetical protein